MAGSPLATPGSFPSAPPKGGGWNEKLLRFGGREGEAIVDYVGAYGPHENPRGNFVERSSISCVQWDIGIKRMVRESRICFCIF